MTRKLPSSRRDPAGRRKDVFSRQSPSSAQGSQPAHAALKASAPTGHPTSVPVPGTRGAAHGWAAPCVAQTGGPDPSAPIFRPTINTRPGLDTCRGDAPRRQAPCQAACAAHPERIRVSSCICPSNAIYRPAPATGNSIHLRMEHIMARHSSPRHIVGAGKTWRGGVRRARAGLRRAPPRACVPACAPSEIARRRAVVRPWRSPAGRPG